VQSGARRGAGAANCDRGVLQVINSSLGEFAPAFEAMLDEALRLCNAVLGAFWIIDGEHGRLAAAQGLPAEFVELARERGLMGTNPALQQSANRLFSALVKIAAFGRGFAGRR
jgi:hypothetical protein